MSRTKDQIEDEDLEQDSGFDPSVIQSGEDSDDLLAKVRHLRETIGYDEPITLRLRKKEAGKFVFIDKLENEEPDTHQIGIKHGAGEYQLYVTWMDEKGKTKTATHRFDLGPHYNRLRKQNEADNDFMQSPEDRMARIIEEKLKPDNSAHSIELFMTMMQQNQERFQAQLAEDRRAREEADRRREESNRTMFTTLATVLAPVILKMVDKPAPPVVEQKESSLDKLMLAMLPKMLEQKEQVSPITQLKELMEIKDMLGSGEKAPEKSWMDVAETVVTALVENAGTILSPFASKQLVQAQLAGQIEANPQIAPILEDDEKFKHTVGKLLEQLGPEKTRTILDKTGKLDKALALGFVF